ncbi:hypothetical protein L7F22_054577 [Adiantum nelumboides]|nr:hypothetical protein [Adiantum nelumboides]
MESCVGKEMDAAEVDVPLRGTFSGDPFESLRPPPPPPPPPPSASAIGIHLSSHTLRAIHESTVSLEACSLACKVVGSLCSARLLKDYFQASLLHVNFKIVNVSPLGRGFFRVQFESARQAMEVLAQGPVDFHFAIGFLAKWTQGMDLNGLKVELQLQQDSQDFFQSLLRMKGHVVAACTRRRISLDQRQQVSKQEALHANGGLDDRLVRRRSEAEKARRKGGKKRRRRARKTEAPKLVYRRRENVSPLPSDTTSSPLHDPPPDSQGSGLDISSSYEGINSAPMSGIFLLWWNLLRSLLRRSL